jgi:hypothetical protein
MGKISDYLKQMAKEGKSTVVELMLTSGQTVTGHIVTVEEDGFMQVAVHQQEPSGPTENIIGQFYTHISFVSGCTVYGEDF